MICTCVKNWAAGGVRPHSNTFERHRLLSHSGALCPSGFFEMKMKYDESDNAFIRASRAVTDRVTDFVGKTLFRLLCSDWLMADGPMKCLHIL